VAPARTATRTRRSTTPTIKANTTSALPLERSDDRWSSALWERLDASTCSPLKAAGEFGWSARPVRSASSTARMSLPKAAYSPIASWRSWTVCSSPWRPGGSLCSYRRETDTFEITVEASGIATVECENPAGNVAPGQDTAVDVAGSSGPPPTPRNGQFVFTVETDPPTVPNVPTCPNPQWTARVIDVAFGDATLSLFEDGVLSDTVTVPVT
jgi:hypothetical protein